MPNRFCTTLLHASHHAHNLHVWSLFQRERICVTCLYPMIINRLNLQFLKRQHPPATSPSGQRHHQLAPRHTQGLGPDIEPEVESAERVRSMKITHVRVMIIVSTISSRLGGTFIRTATFLSYRCYLLLTFYFGGFQTRDRITR